MEQSPETEELNRILLRLEVERLRPITPYRRSDRDAQRVSQLVELLRDLTNEPHLPL